MVEDPKGCLLGIAAALVIDIILIVLALKLSGCI